MAKKKDLNIISWSRKTDGPSFYYNEFQNDLERKFVVTRNPHNGETSTISLHPNNVHSIVLWSKNYGNVVNDPRHLQDYDLYFNFTITGYNNTLERNVINSNIAVRQMERLANTYSPEQIMWRFDPIILSTQGEATPTFDKVGKARLEMFEKLGKDISSFGVKHCSISFMTLYGAVEHRLKKHKFNYINLNNELQQKFTEHLVEIADKYGITIYSCANPILNSVQGVKKGCCIDGKRLDRLFNKMSSHAKDPGQRPDCGCTPSIDVGSYDQVCKHSCLYCYVSKNA